MTLPSNERVIIAETGDIFFTLRNPDTPFAVWKPAIEENSTTENKEAGRDDNQKPKNGTTSDTLHEGSSGPSPEDDTRPAIVYRVSSQHLIAASAKFKSEFTSWSESLKGDDGFYHVTTTDWDPEAFGILLNILHLRFRQVTRSPSLELVAKVSKLVDYYRCWEAFDLIADIWITHLRAVHPMRGAYNRELMLWMLVSWVFKLNVEFTYSTKMALRQSNESSIQDMELGIPPAILQTLESRRSILIKEVMEVCLRWFHTYSSTWVCKGNKDLSFECSSMLLGAFTKLMISIGMLFPQPTAPFNGVSLEKVHDNIICMITPTWYSRLDLKPPVSSMVKHSCSFKMFILEANDVYEKAQGLVLSDFVDRAESTIDIVPRHS